MARPLQNVSYCGASDVLCSIDFRYLYAPKRHKKPLQLEFEYNRKNDNDYKYLRTAAVCLCVLNIFIWIAFHDFGGRLAHIIVNNSKFHQWHKYKYRTWWHPNVDRFHIGNGWKWLLGLRVLRGFSTERRQHGRDNKYTVCSYILCWNGQKIWWTYIDAWENNKL